LHGIAEADARAGAKASLEETMRRIVATIAAMLAIAVIMATSAGPARTGAVDDEIDAFSYSYAGYRAKR
jgi:hypothetical protein